MIICVDMSRDTKEMMDSFIAAGDYKDYAELVESAVMNLYVLRSHMTQAKALVLERSKGGKKPKPTVPEPQGTRPAVTPEIFQLHTTQSPPVFATIADTSGAAAKRYLPQQWLFGQYNKLLPVKATCRAIRRLLKTTPEGVDLAVATAEITDAAVSLRQVLLRMDSERGSGKGESLAAGFPGNEEKARLRFANQFIGSTTRSGSVTGFPADLKLIGLVNGGRKATISLTREGWNFTEFDNSVLDRNDPSARLSDHEVSFLLQHINDHVPAERAAYVTILGALTNGSATPGELDAALREFVGDVEIKPSHLATQRAGAVARMFDLGLLGREKNGLFVRYFVKDQGADFLERAGE